MNKKISIFRNGVWAGDGRLDRDGQIVDCAAILGATEDASDETYVAIEDAISDEPQDAERYTGRGSIERPDGTYSWTITEADWSIQRRALLARAPKLVVIDDEAERWVSERREVYRWLGEHSVESGYDARTGLNPVAVMDAEQYEEFCGATPCIAGGGASDGEYSGDHRELIEAALDAGATMLYIR